MMNRFLRALCLLPLLLTLPTRAAEDLVYTLPTENDALYRGDNEGFFMYCDRTFEREKSKPWEAGSFGMVRNPFRTAAGQLFFGRLHEGIDVKPMRRDAAGEPLDPVHPLAPGRVEHVNESPGASNYGRYVVVSHEIPEGIIYTLYAHLSKVNCKPGDEVQRTSELGILGHSGVGLNLERAHCHVEIALMVNSAYDRMTGDYKHGLFHGFNLIGFNAADILLQSKGNKPVSIAKYLESLPEHYRVRVPCVGTMDILRRHPFLYKGSFATRPASLEMSFTQEGIPRAVYPSTTPVTEPVVVACKPVATLQQNVTMNRLKGSSKDAALTATGRTFINRFLWIEGKYPPGAKAIPPKDAATGLKAAARRPRSTKTTRRRP